MGRTESFDLTSPSSDTLFSVSSDTYGEYGDFDKDDAPKCCLGWIPLKVGMFLAGSFWLMLTFVVLAMVFFNWDCMEYLGFSPEVVRSFVTIQFIIAVGISILLLLGLLKENHGFIYPYLIYLGFGTFLYILIGILLAIYLSLFNGDDYWTRVDFRLHTTGEDYEVAKAEDELVRRLNIVIWGMLILLLLVAAFGTWFFSVIRRGWIHFRNKAHCTITPPPLPKSTMLSMKKPGGASDKIIRPQVLVFPPAEDAMNVTVVEQQPPQKIPLSPIASSLSVPSALDVDDTGDQDANNNYQS